MQKCFQPDISTFSHFRQWAHDFLVIFSKVHEFVQNSDFRARSARFVISALGTTLFGDFSKVHYFLQVSLFSARSARFVICARGHHFSTVCSKVNEFVQNTSFQPEISTFWHFPTQDTHFLKGYTTIKRFSAKCTSLYKTEVFSPKSPRFVIFALCTPLLNAF